MAEDRLTIVTGASENHARPLRHLLESLDHYEPQTRVIVYDLGLAPSTARALRRHGRHLVPFRFADYPSHVHRLGTYAWKPAIVHEVLLEYGLPLLWLDAGNLVHERLDRVRAELAQVGFYSPHSPGTIARWCHPLTIAALGIEPDILGEQNRNAAMVGFGDCPLGRELVAAWREQSMRPEVICPPGSSRRNHRADQTILSVLLARAIRRHGLAATERRLGLSTHNDDLSRRDARHYMRCNPAEGQRRALRAAPLGRPLRIIRRAWRRLRENLFQ